MGPVLPPRADGRWLVKHLDVQLDGQWFKPSKKSPKMAFVWFDIIFLIMTKHDFNLNSLLSCIKIDVLSLGSFKFNGLNRLRSLKVSDNYAA